MLLRANVIAKGYSGARPELAELLLANAQRRAVSADPGAGERRRERRPRAARASRARADRRRNAVIERRSQTAAPRPTNAAAQRRARAGHARPEGRNHAHQRHAGAHGDRGARCRRRAIASGDTAHVAGAMSLEALLGTPVAFDARIHDARGQIGQARSAALLRDCSPTARSASRIATAIRACRMRMRCAACRRCTGRCSTRSTAIDGVVGARAERGDRQSARVRERRAAERRKLPRAVGGDGARLARDRADEPRHDGRAADRPARASGPQPGTAAISHARSRA